MVKRVLLASPRGYCAGVERAVETVEHALEHYGAPVYVRKQIVHNIHVVRDLEARGAIFVDEETEVPERDGRLLGARRRPERACELGAARATIIDAVALVTMRAGRHRLFADEGYHDRPHRARATRRSSGRWARRRTRPSSSRPSRRRKHLDPDPEARLRDADALSVDETGEIIKALRRRFPEIRAPRKEDICYATSNRQWAVREMLAEIDLLLVIGSRNSSNSNASSRPRGPREHRHLIDDERDRRGVARGTPRPWASRPAPPRPRSSSTASATGSARAASTDIEPYRLMDEDVTFRLPIELRRELELAARS